MKLRGVLDAFATVDPWYNAPEEFNGESTEQSTVYRIGVIAHELFTGSLPYESDSAGQPKETIASANLTTESISTDDLPPQITDELVKSLSSNPADRHETVLHLRDSLATV